MNRRFNYHILIVWAALSVWFLFTLGGCLNAPDLPSEPVITNISLSKNSMKQGNLNNDSLIFAIEFTDGDGNFGSDNIANIFIKDSRNENLVYEYKAPLIPEQGVNNGIKGTIYLTMYTICCFTEQNPSCCLDKLGCPAQNNVYFIVTIRDRGGKVSNEYKTAEIALLCL